MPAATPLSRKTHVQIFAGTDTKYIATPFAVRNASDASAAAAGADASAAVDRAAQHGAAHLLLSHFYTPEAVRQAYDYAETLSILFDVIASDVDQAPQKVQKEKESKAVWRRSGSVYVDGPETTASDIHSILIKNLIEILRALQAGCETMVLIGHSRGACAAIVTLHLLQTLKVSEWAENSPFQVLMRDQNNDLSFQKALRDFGEMPIEWDQIKKNLDRAKFYFFGLDPVPGGSWMGVGAPLKWHDDRFYKMPSICTRASIFYAAHENSRCFKCVVPQAVDPTLTDLMLYSIPGHHGTASGNLLRQIRTAEPDADRAEVSAATAWVQYAVLLEAVVFLQAAGVVLKPAFEQVVSSKEYTSLLRAAYAQMLTHGEIYQRFFKTCYPTGCEESWWIAALKTGSRIVHYQGHTDTPFVAVFPRMKEYVNMRHAALSCTIDADAEKTGHGVSVTGICQYLQKTRQDTHSLRGATPTLTTSAALQPLEMLVGYYASFSVRVEEREALRTELKATYTYLNDLAGKRSAVSAGAKEQLSALTALVQSGLEKSFEFLRFMHNRLVIKPHPKVAASGNRAEREREQSILAFDHQAGDTERQKRAFEAYCEMFLCDLNALTEDDQVALGLLEQCKKWRKKLQRWMSAAPSAGTPAAPGETGAGKIPDIDSSESDMEGASDAPASESDSSGQSVASEELWRQVKRVAETMTDTEDFIAKIMKLKTQKAPATLTTVHEQALCASLQDRDNADAQLLAQACIALSHCKLSVSQKVKKQRSPGASETYAVLQDMQNRYIPALSVLMNQAIARCEAGFWRRVLNAVIDFCSLVLEGLSGGRWRPLYKQCNAMRQAFDLEAIGWRGRGPSTEDKKTLEKKRDALHTFFSLSDQPTVIIPSSPVNRRGGT